jgi:outer membrane protein OmpA-like peptidoglycan-associated protein
MQNRILAGAALLGAVALGGCATEDYVNKHVAVVQTQVTDVQTRQQAQGQKLDTVDQNAKDAMARAEAAGKLAEGKFLYNVTLQDDATKFALNKYALSDDERAKLTDFANKLKTDNRNVYLEIQGHTDSRGPKNLNMQLGEQRAEAVRLFMNKQGVALNRMSTISYGDTSPVAPNDTRQGRAQNRRVVVIVLD